MNHKTRQVRQSLGDAVLLAGQASDGPAHPALGGVVDRLMQVRSGVQAVQHSVVKVSTVSLERVTFLFECGPFLFKEWLAPCALEQVI